MNNIIFDFNKTADIKNWSIVNDVVMGGKSNSFFSLNDNGNGIFKGHVSLENNGGFSMVRYRFSQKNIQEYTKVVLYLKGDEKNYQFRLKTKTSDSFSYISSFKTDGNWQEISIPLKNMFPAYRGRKLEKPNFNDAYIEEIAFLIGNKKEEDFMLQIDKISLK